MTSKTYKLDPVKRVIRTKSSQQPSQSDLPWTTITLSKLWYTGGTDNSK